MSDSLRPRGLAPTKLLRPWGSPGKNTGVGCHFLLQGIFPTQGSNPGLLHWRQTLYRLSHQGSQKKTKNKCLSEVKPLSRVRLFVTLWTVAYQAPPSMGFFRQEYWKGLTFPSAGDLPDPGIKPGSPTLQADALPSEPPGKSKSIHQKTKIRQATLSRLLII